MVTDSIQHGNEPSIDILYSRAAMLIRVPPYADRNSGKPAPKSIYEGIKSDGQHGYDDDDYDYDDYYESMEEDESEEENEETLGDDN